jgi:RNA polymerase primary sigma factor
MKTRRRENTIRERRNKTVKNFLTEYDTRKQLSGQDEIELAKQARNGDLTALSLLVNAHLKLVKAVAMHYRKQGLSVEELTYAGNIGLIKAASRFDTTKADTFRHYAIWWIRQSILKALHEQAQISLAPSIMIQELWQISNRFNNLEADADLEPSDKEMANLLQAKVYEIARLHSLTPIAKA